MPQCHQALTQSTAAFLPLFKFLLLCTSLRTDTSPCAMWCSNQDTILDITGRLGGLQYMQVLLHRVTPPSPGDFKKAHDAKIQPKSAKVSRLQYSEATATAEDLNCDAGGHSNGTRSLVACNK